MFYAEPFWSLHHPDIKRNRKYILNKRNEISITSFSPSPLCDISVNHKGLAQWKKRTQRIRETKFRLPLYLLFPLCDKFFVLSPPRTEIKEKRRIHNSFNDLSEKKSCCPLPFPPQFPHSPFFLILHQIRSIKLSFPISFLRQNLDLLNHRWLVSTSAK